MPVNCKNVHFKFQGDVLKCLVSTYRSRFKSYLVYYHSVVKKTGWYSHLRSGNTCILDYKLIFKLIKNVEHQFVFDQ